MSLVGGGVAETRRASLPSVAQCVAVSPRGDWIAVDRFEPDMRGTVNHVDPRARTIELERVEPLLTGFNTRRSDYVVLRYDEETRVEFEGRLYSPENLERGDIISVDTRSIEDELLAEHIRVDSDVNERTSLID